MIPLSFIVVEIFNKQHCCSKWQPGSSVAGWSPKYLFMFFYVSIVSLICLFFIVVEILGKQHCCSKWTALKLCCRLMSKISIHVLRCVYSIVDLSYSLWLRYLANSTAAASDQSWSYVASWCLKYLYMFLYVSIVSLICLLFMIIEISGKQHCCSKWTALNLCCRLMSNIAIHVLICVSTIADLSMIHYSWSIRHSALLPQVHTLEVMLQLDV